MTNSNRSKLLGVIGGMGSHATVHAFRRLVEMTPAASDQEYIETIVHNNVKVPDRTRSILYGGEDAYTELKRSVELLNQCGADYIILTCITAHYYIDRLAVESKAEIIDAVKETAVFLNNMDPPIRRAGILATTGTLKSGTFQKWLNRQGIESISLEDRDQEMLFMDSVYAEWGIKTGHFTGKPKTRIMRAAKRLIENGAEVIIAGCTEIPLVLKEDESEVPLVDPMHILLTAAIEKCLCPERK